MNPGDGAGGPAGSVVVDGVRLRRGSLVRLRPARRADVFDLTLAGRVAEVDTVEEDLEGRTHVAVTLAGDPGRDFRTGLGHRFFFAPDELEPFTDPGAGETVGQPSVLVAGIGNVFLADDAFGPEVITALGDQVVPPGVHVVDFGIRGMDLAYRLLDGYAVALLVDAAPRGAEPGTLHLLEVEPAPATDAVADAHGMDPVTVLALARRLGGDAAMPRVLVLGCEPLTRMTGDEPDVVVELSAPVRQAVTRAVPLVWSLVAELLRDPAADLTDPSPARTPAHLTEG